MYRNKRVIVYGLFNGEMVYKACNILEKTAFFEMRKLGYKVISLKDRSEIQTRYNLYL